MAIVKLEHMEGIKSPEQKLDEADLFKKRMLEWPNPVEFVNNMYGCHPGQEGSDYFSSIYRKS